MGVKVRERLPDSVLAEADEIVDVDLATEDLRKRLEEGKVYPAERVGRPWRISLPPRTWKSSGS